MGERRSRASEVGPPGQVSRGGASSAAGARVANSKVNFNLPTFLKVCGKLMRWILQGSPEAD